MKEHTQVIWPVAVSVQTRTVVRQHLALDVFRCSSVRSAAILGVLSANLTFTGLLQDRPSIRD
jgi:hypothetical protein